MEAGGRKGTGSKAAVTKTIGIAAKAATPSASVTLGGPEATIFSTLYPAFESSIPTMIDSAAPSECPQTTIGSFGSR